MVKRILLADNSDSAGKIVELLRSSLPSLFYSVDHEKEIVDVLKNPNCDLIVLRSNALPKNGTVMETLEELYRRRIQILIVPDEDFEKEKEVRRLSDVSKNISVVEKKFFDKDPNSIGDKIRETFQKGGINKGRVAIVGLGNVGKQIAEDLYVNTHLDDLILYSRISDSRTEVDITRLEVIRSELIKKPSARPGLEPIIAKSLDDIRDESGIIVICIDNSRLTSDVKVKRSGLLKYNYESIRDIISKFRGYTGNILIVTNPVDYSTLLACLAYCDSPTKLDNVMEASKRIQGVSYIDHIRALKSLEEEFRRVEKVAPEQEVKVDCRVLGPHDTGAFISAVKFYSIPYDRYKGFSKDIIERLSRKFIAEYGGGSQAVAINIKEAIRNHVEAVMSNSFLERASALLDLREEIPNLTDESYKPLCLGVPGQYISGTFIPRIRKGLSQRDHKSLMAVSLEQQGILEKMIGEDTKKYRLLAEYLKSI